MPIRLSECWPPRKMPLPPSWRPWRPFQTETMWRFAITVDEVAQFIEVTKVAMNDILRARKDAGVVSSDPWTL